ncbi:ZZ type zinc finger domain protein [Aspergillus lucknowensis]|uniref:ZZ-type domain-containing protein n=1 Tax=Aspergillus lucknowensis TaxID=176173 RepID=A0ABR4LER5_9EURO
MSAPTAAPVLPTTLITVKVTFEGHTRRFKIPLKDLGAGTLPQNLRQLLGIPADTNVIFERYSDSAGAYVCLDSNNPAVFKQLYRAAKAKLKLRIKATVDQSPTQVSAPETSSEHPGSARYSYLETVLSSPIPAAQAETNPSATTSSTILPESSERSTLPEADKDIWSTTETDVLETANHREFVLGPDNPGVPVASHTSLAGVFCIDCNYCGRAIPNEHYHCNTCADGDYDLCPQCLDSGVTCLGEDHWLVRRFVKDGIITNSTTKTLASHKIKSQEEKSLPEPAPKSTPETVEKPNPIGRERICNNCLKDFDENKMVSCADCEDFDLCITCVLGHKHGHHPAHTFVLLGEHDSGLKNLVLSRCKPGRGYHHAAICDGCENHITGVRHKCLTCPDWDYCSECHLSAARSHPGHRFAPLYTAISEPLQSHEVHFGVFCDGPLCKDKRRPGFITGVRYKCSVCHDTDFCAKCEVHPANTHNRTHPMVMFKTPVRSVTVSTVHENALNQTSATVGDRPQRSTSTQVSAPLSSLSSQLQSLETVTKEEADLVADSMPSDQQTSNKEEQRATPKQTPSHDIESQYQAFFIEDTIADRTVMRPHQVFQQTWKLYNPGPRAWPAGAQVRFVGGDFMFNVDVNHPSSLASVTAAMESNTLSEPLEVGGKADFTVTLRAPRRPGTAISYWRLKLDDGMPFGHKLWCDIQVRDDVVEDETVSGVEAPEVPAADHSDTSGSQMVFPKLDKESPETSTHEATGLAPTAPSVSSASDHDLLDEVASLALDDADTETGFLTDEEYDILDASDQEFMDANSTRN